MKKKKALTKSQKALRAEHVRRAKNIGITTREVRQMTNEDIRRALRKYGFGRFFFQGRYW